MKNKFSIAMSLAVMLTMMVTSMAFAGAPSAPALQSATPTIWSDLPDYAPGETVNLFGAGWQAGESVHIFVNDNVGSSWSRNVDVLAAADGTITDTFQLPNWFVATYSVTASGAASGTVTTTFTDGNTTLVSGTVTDFNTSLAISGATITCTAGCNAVISTTTNASGNYFFDGLAGHGAKLTFAGNGPVNLTLTASKSGYTSESLTLTGVNNGNSFTGKNFALKPSIQDQTITFGALGNKTYGDADFGVSATASSGLAVSFTASGACTVSGSTVHITGAGSCTITAHQAGNASYNPAPDVEQSFNIAQADALIAVSGYSGVYDAAAHGASGTATGIGGVDLSSGLNLGATYTNVPGGTANWTFEGGANYLDESGSVQIVISQADATVNVVGYTGNYDGAAHGASGTATGVGGADLGAGLNFGATYTDVPGGNAHWTFEGGTNYLDESGNVTITINKAPVTATAGSGSLIYNGATQSPSACAVTGTYTGDLSCTNNPASVGPNAGTTAIAPVVIGTGLSNFEINSVDGSYTIEKADASIVVTPYDVTYNGSAHTATGTATGVNSEDLSTDLDLSGTVHTDAGTYSDTWTFTDSTGNYNNDSGTVTDKIAQAPVTATAGSGSSTYDGATHSPSACAVTGAYTGDLFCANNPASVGPNAGTTVIAPVVSGTGLSNFAVTSVNGSYTINKADATCTVTGYSVVYDGNPHTATGSCTGIGGSLDVLSGLDLSNTTHSLVGTYLNDPWIFTDITGNYNDANGTVNDYILAWTLTGFYAPVDRGIHNIVKGGATVPLKFEVFAGPTELTNTSIVSAFTQKISCAAGLGDDIEQYSTGSTSLRYDTASGQFIFNWKTLKAPGSCYRVTLTTSDGSSIFADFTLK